MIIRDNSGISTENDRKIGGQRGTMRAAWTRFSARQQRTYVKNHSATVKNPLNVAGNVNLEAGGWIPAIVVLKICKDKNAQNVISSAATKPRSEAGGTASFAYELDQPMKKGKYYIVAVAIGEESAASEAGTTKETNKVLKSEPVMQEFEVTDK